MELSNFEKNHNVMAKIGFLTSNNGATCAAEFLYAKVYN